LYVILITVGHVYTVETVSAI